MSGICCLTRPDGINITQEKAEKISMIFTNRGPER